MGPMIKHTVNRNHDSYLLGKRRQFILELKVNGCGPGTQTQFTRILCSGIISVS